MSNCDRQGNIEDPIKDADNFDCRIGIGDELIITIKDASNFTCKKKHWVNGLIMTRIFFALRALNVEQPKALLVSAVVACLLHLPI